MAISTQNSFDDAATTRRRVDTATVAEVSPRLHRVLSESSSSPRLGKSRQLRTTLLLILASTLVPSAIILWLNPRPAPLKEYFITPFVSLVYSSCIGGLLSTGLNLFLRRVYDKSRFVKFTYLIVLIATATIVGFALGSFILLGINASAGFSYFNIDRMTWRISLFMGILFGAVMFAGDSLKLKLEKTELELRTQQLSEAKAKNLATEARLSSLESRVRPHFLFNTLNSISALVKENPEQAERTIERLAALLRFSLEATDQKTVRLADEIKVVCDYLEIEKTRFGSRLRFSFEIGEQAENCRVPPFALQTLVENSIKHHVAKNRAGGEIRVCARCENDSLRLEVWDDGAGFDESDITENHGLDNLQKRLSELYGAEARLVIERRGNFTVVSVSGAARTETI